MPILFLLLLSNAFFLVLFRCVSYSLFLSFLPFKNKNNIGPSGKYRAKGDGDFGARCLSCSTGRVSSTLGAVSAAACSFCPKGTYFNRNSQSGSACESCVSGQYQDQDSTLVTSGCKKCPPGKSTLSHTATSFDSCTDCPLGRFEYSNTRICTDCGSGTYQNETGTIRCKRCPTGKYSTGLGKMSSSACAFCSVGDYFVSSSTSCKSCEAGKYQDQGNAAVVTCKNCPSGKTSSARSTSSSSCVFCSAGYYFVSSGVGCNSCGVAKYQDSATTASVMCINCPAGKTSSAGSTNLSSCLPDISTYVLNTNKLTWQAASTHCQSLGGYLPVVRSAAENTKVKAMASSRNVWIGVNDLSNEGQWRWVDGSTASVSTVKYHLVTSGSGCGARGYSSVTSISECSTAGASLRLGDTSASSDGQTRVSFDPPYCYYEGYSLKFNSGGTNTGTCTTTDQCLCKETLSSSTSSYSNWRSGEPNNANNEDCGAMYTGGDWNDLPCSTAVASVCEIPARRW